MSSEDIYLRELIRIESVKFGEWIVNNSKVYFAEISWEYDGNPLDTFALYDKYYNETHTKTEQK